MNRLTKVIAVAASSATIVALAAGSAASAGTHAPVTKATAAASAARAALRYVTANPPATNQAVPGVRQSAQGVTMTGSYNWSGYANDNSTGKTYSKVSGTWTEPAVTCPTKEESLAAFWAGIDGWNSNTVEQSGTLAQCFEGTAFYYTWWEMYPTNSIQTVGTTVKPGDKITASVVKTSTSYALKVTDSTTSGNNVSTTQSCAATTCVDHSAEWIGEAPGGTRGEYPLSNFKKWTVTGASVTSGTTSGHISTFPADDITMDSDANYALAKPGALNSTGNSFTDTWDNSY
jgi:hypothetical protein